MIPPSREPSSEQVQSDDTEEALCLCEWVTREEIVAAIPHARDARHLKELTRACTVCFGCEGDFDELVAQHAQRFGTAPGGARA